MKITIVEVAKKAKVSVATVSRVMNGNYPVKEETRQAVLKAIKELNYIPNMQAKELTQRRSTTIGVIVPSINNMFFPEVIYGIETALKNTDFSLVLSCSNNNNKDEEIKCTNNFIGRNVAGIIVIDPNTENIRSNFFEDISIKMPLVFVNGFLTSSSISSISNDEFFGAKLALSYLNENNHNDILFLRGKDSYSYDIKENAYTEFMQSINNFDVNNIINIGEGNNIKTVDNTTELLITFLKGTSSTAIFACNDLMAVGALNACKKLNLKVPSDISIIGYDNIDLSKFVEPKLTTIDQNMYLLGTNAADLLIEKIDSENKISKNVTLNNRLVKRDTVASR